MSIQTYTCGFMTSTGDKVIPLLTLDNEGNVALKQGRFCPGDMVKHALCGGRGTVIGVVDCEVVVLWSEEPYAERKAIRSRSYSSIARDLIKVDPLPLPEGANIFYYDKDDE